ncbi:MULTISPECIES: UDP-glucose/GDP-mannose dehydrogenase family protein [unclassified Acidovorax]|uniref:UDP-glucose dehydrogenase family protein n=1 Tax=unclassified Acidovorax TaxID=2684926 RepID=UPI001C47CDAA|nr:MULTISPECIES: UDP-glucose/GDP-mannose dehydrogenase family protein [unclassified Acidovorax]MBV7430824.1 UDP-glucose/GDP-mannose dehydrogenase family protein [Acidovorax sp. sif0732]MBV7451930.1 UDP-glucose/GDP-mannose dehydrogenase family protein [Acidovorax sp. sif0715]
MNLTLFGTGYVGLVTGVCLAELGNDVLCIDTDADKIAALQRGEVPIYEPGLQELVVSNSRAGRLGFSTDMARGVAHGDVQFIAVGTPSAEDGSADLRHVFDVAGAIATHMTGFKVIVNKSTVPVGTGEAVRRAVAATLARRGEGADPAPGYAVVSNPEFLKEGSAIEDFMRPDRIILGCGDTPQELRAGNLMRELYRPFGHGHDRVICMDRRSAEFTKYAANAMLATRISFMNEMANLADRLGVDIEPVRVGIGADPRIGESFLYPGVGYGGSCFPKDVTALQRMGEEVGLPLRLLAAVAQVNDRQKRLLVDKLAQRLGPDLSGRRLAVWGLAFKPNTDDMREASSRVLVRELLERGAVLRVFDPVAMQEARRCMEEDLRDRPELLEHISYAQDPIDAARGADALLIVTEWQVFRSPNFDALRAALRQPLVVDGRNLYEPRSMRALGFDYLTVGRSAADALGAMAA